MFTSVKTQIQHYHKHKAYLTFSSHFAKIEIVSGTIRKTLCWPSAQSVRGCAQRPLPLPVTTDSLIPLRPLLSWQVISISLNTSSNLKFFPKLSLNNLYFSSVWIFEPSWALRRYFSTLMVRTENCGVEILEPSSFLSFVFFLYSEKVCCDSVDCDRCGLWCMM